LTHTVYYANIAGRCSAMLYNQNTVGLGEKWRFSTSIREKYSISQTVSNTATITVKRER